MQHLWYNNIKYGLAHYVMVESWLKADVWQHSAYLDSFSMVLPRRELFSDFAGHNTSHEARSYIDEIILFLT